MAKPWQRNCAVKSQKNNECCKTTYKAESSTSEEMQHHVDVHTLQRSISQEALDVSSSLWATLDDSNLFVGVPYCIKRQIIDFKHMIKRCTEEEVLVKDEITRVAMFYQRKLGVLDSWSKKLADATDSADYRSRGLLALVLSKRDETEAFTLHLQDLFARDY